MKPAVQMLRYLPLEHSLSEAALSAYLGMPMEIPCTGSIPACWLRTLLPPALCRSGAGARCRPS